MQDGPVVEEWSVKELWEKYEDITMHFNDLLIRLRTQALGGVAALSTLVGIFGKSGADAKTSWEMATGVFALLCLVWVAIWIIDFCYYNRLLVGAVRALLALEKVSKTKSRIRQIELSTIIEETVAGKLDDGSNWRANVGRWAFYWIVLVALLVGFMFSFSEYRSA